MCGPVLCKQCSPAAVSTAPQGSSTCSLAAVAEHYQAVVLHYDSDFEHVAVVSGQQTAWVAPRETAG